MAILAVRSPEMGNPAMGDWFTDAVGSVTKSISETTGGIVGWISGSTRQKQELDAQVEIAKAQAARQAAQSQFRSQSVTKIVTVVGAIGLVGLAGYIWIRARKRDRS